MLRISLAEFAAAGARGSADDYDGTRLREESFRDEQDVAGLRARRLHLLPLRHSLGLLSHGSLRSRRDRHHSEVGAARAVGAVRSALPLGVVVRALLGTGRTLEHRNLARREGLTVARAHLHHLNPFPRNLGEVLARFERVLIPEMNLGQLALLIQGRYLKPVVSYAKVEGKPFFRHEIHRKIREVLGA